VTDRRHVPPARTHSAPEIVLDVVDGVVDLALLVAEAFAQLAGGAFARPSASSSGSFIASPVFSLRTPFAFSALPRISSRFIRGLRFRSRDPKNSSAITRKILHGDCQRPLSVPFRYTRKRRFFQISPICPSMA
jgi:hypothetical protein